MGELTDKEWKAFQKHHDKHYGVQIPWLLHELEWHDFPQEILDILRERQDKGTEVHSFRWSEAMCQIENIAKLQCDDLQREFLKDSIHFAEYGNYGEENDE